MQLRFYFDDDIAARGLIRSLRAAGVDAVAPYEAGMYGQSDGSHLLHASADGRALCSANRGDFIQLHGQWMRDGRHHAGIVLINQQQHSIGEQLRRLLRSSAEQAAEDMMDRLEFLTAWPAQEA